LRHRHHRERTAADRRDGDCRRAHRAGSARGGPCGCARHAVAARRSRCRTGRRSHWFHGFRRRRARRCARRLPRHRCLRRLHGTGCRCAQGGLTMTWLACLFLLSGAAICLLAAVGVLRLPDFFMRMHAATKAGVAGCGLMLIGVAIADNSPATWVKVTVALVFLLLTTPVAGHLLGRAAYVSGAPFWQGTEQDALRGVLPRSGIEFDGTQGAVDRTETGRVRTVVLALAKGPHLDAAI